MNINNLLCLINCEKCDVSWIQIIKDYKDYVARTVYKDNWSDLFNIRTKIYLVKSEKKRRKKEKAV